MVSKICRASFLIVGSGLSSGCALVIPQSYVQPSEVTLPQAMKDVACGIKTLQNESSRINAKSGTLIDQVDVTLNLKASATGDSTLSVDAKPAVPAAMLASLGINYTDKTETIGERGNQIKITLKNIYTASLNNPGKSAVSRRNQPIDLGPTVYYPVDNPC